MKQIPAIDLTWPEWPFYNAGRRIADRAPERWTDAMPTVDELYIRLDAKERRLAAGTPFEFVQCWVAIGIMAWHLEQAVAAARTL